MILIEAVEAMTDEEICGWRPQGPSWKRDRDRQLIALRAVSPKRSSAPQADVDGLALFDTVRQPSLI